MEIIISIVVCVVLLIIFSLPRRRKGYQPIVQPDLENAFPLNYKSPYTSPTKNNPPQAD